MADDAYLFDKDLTQRTVDAIKTVSGTVTRASVPNRRRRGGGKSSIASIDAPFKMSLAKNDSDEQIIKISSGLVDNFAIESNSVNLQEFSTSTTVYVYVKISADWTNASGDFKGVATLDIKTGEDPINSNFEKNDTKFPVSDSGNVFFSIGTVEITEKEGNLSYKINQISFSNFYTEVYSMDSFIMNAIWLQKVSDVADDNSYQVYVNGGEVVQPEARDDVEQIEFVIVKTATKYSYIEISATQQANGGWTGFTSDLIDSVDTKSNTDDINYFLVATINGGIISQNRTGAYDSGGRVN